MTRAYMAQNGFRLACDEATKYFQFNFPVGHFQSASYSLAMSVPTPGTLHIESETTVPATVLKMFGNENPKSHESASWAGCIEERKTREKPWLHRQEVHHLHHPRRIDKFEVIGTKIGSLRLSQ